MNKSKVCLRVSTKPDLKGQGRKGEHYKCKKQVRRASY